MVAPGDNQLGCRQRLGEALEGLDHEFQALVRSPLAECQNAMLRIAAPGKIRIFRPSRQDPVRPHVHIVAAILVLEDLAIPRH